VLYLPDYGNNRLLGFNTLPTVNNTHADFVLGQPDFTTTTSGTSAIKFSDPVGVAFDNGKMFLLDTGSGRVLIWNSIPTGGGVPADVVLGEVDLDTNESGRCNATDISPEALWAVDGGR